MNRNAALTLDSARLTFSVEQSARLPLPSLMPHCLTDNIANLQHGQETAGHLLLLSRTNARVSQGTNFLKTHQDNRCLVLLVSVVEWSSVVISVPPRVPLSARSVRQAEHGLSIASTGRCDTPAYEHLMSHHLVLDYSYFSSLYYSVRRRRSRSQSSLTSCSFELVEALEQRRVVISTVQEARWLLS